MEPLTADLRRIHVTVSKAFMEKVAAARAGLSHAHPGASMEQVLDAALGGSVHGSVVRTQPAEHHLALA